MGIIRWRNWKKKDPLVGLNRELNEEIPGCNINGINYIGSISNNDSILIIFVGVIADAEEFINKKLTEGIKVKFFEFSKIKDLKISGNIKEFIIDNKHKYLKLNKLL